jgi:flagellum-specific ATP synthase
VMMGAYAPGNDAALDAAMAARAEMLGFVGQSAKATIDFQASRAALIEGFGS